METAAAAVISGGVSKDSLSPLIDPLGFFCNNLTFGEAGWWSGRPISDIFRL